MRASLRDEEDHKEIQLKGGRCFGMSHRDLDSQNLVDALAKIRVASVV